MKWFREENSRLVKAWEACATLRNKADQTIALGPSGDYFVAAAIGEIAKIGEKAHTIKDLAQGLSNFIEDQGWGDLAFEDVAERLREKIDETLGDQREHFAELEIILIQNLDKGMQEIQRSKRQGAPKRIPVF